MVDIRDILFWIFMFLALALIIWRVFGESPYDFYILLTLLVGLIIKMSKLEGKFYMFEKSFRALAKDFKEHIHK